MNADRVVARFLCEYHRIWQDHFPGLNKRAHWHVIFSARTSPVEGVACRSIHRTVYGFYGTDIRTCIERVKDCERDGFIRVTDASNRPCTASPTCLITATGKLYESFDRHVEDTTDAVYAALGDRERRRLALTKCNDAAIAAIFGFFGAYDQKWRETCEFVVRQKGLTPAHVNDAMDHLVTYQYWAIVMLLWWASPFGSDDADSPALVIDEINSRMWDALRLGHLAIKERVDNLIRWGFFTEQTIKRHKAVALTPVAGSAISKSLAEAKPLLHDLDAKLVSQQAEVVGAQSA
ncbi:MAG: hypothetical protein JO282_12505 [Alphaproteobacteria bacterium]|nr:hypothetical protein [Alphaproteobacteria bacterium]